MSPYSVLLLGTQMAIGGAQKVLLDQAKWFHDRGHGVVAAFFYDRDGLYDKWKNSFRFPLYDLKAFDRDLNFLQKIVSLLAGLWRLWKLLRRQKFDAIVTFTHDSNMLGAPMAWLAGIPVRVGTHLGEIRGMPRWRKKIHALLVNRGVIQVLIAASTRTRQHAIEEGIRPDRVEVIFNGITPFKSNKAKRDETRRELGLRENDLFLLSVGRLVFEKGHEFLVEAMSTVIRSRQNIVAGICGAGPLKGQLEQQILRNALENHVRLLGQWDSVQDLLAAADIFVLPSRWEGLPMALLEAMMAGLPVIATRVEGVDEVVEDGVHGLLVPLEDPPALAEAILQLAGDRQARSRMGAAASLRIAGEYTTDRMCENYLKIILSLGKRRVE